MVDYLPSVSTSWHILWILNDSSTQRLAGMGMVVLDPVWFISALYLLYLLLSERLL